MEGDEKEANRGNEGGGGFLSHPRARQCSCSRSAPSAPGACQHARQEDGASLRQICRNTTNTMTNTHTQRVSAAEFQLLKNLLSLWTRRHLRDSGTNHPGQDNTSM